MCVKLVSGVTGDDVKTTKPVRLPSQGNAYCTNLVWDLTSEEETSIQLVVYEADKTQPEELFSCGMSRHEIEDHFAAPGNAAAAALQQVSGDGSDGGSTTADATPIQRPGSAASGT